jgi:hypothetical protein
MRIRRGLTTRATIALLLTATTFSACLPTPDDPEARARVVQGGEIVVVHEGNELIVVFFDFRGLNHYTGWVYASGDSLESDPLGNRPFQADRIAPNWFRVDAG